MTDQHLEMRGNLSGLFTIVMWSASGLLLALTHRNSCLCVLLYANLFEHAADCVPVCAECRDFRPAHPVRMHRHFVELHQKRDPARIRRATLMIYNGLTLVF
ncbi:MAG: hypothetical protein PHD48_08470 [Alphaproteobacteria bacterium]|nr:hypothetical protein [Alphaproteobacteria bacterium]